jgi:hypothetical protein
MAATTSPCLSAREFAPSLVPHLLYGGGGDEAFLAWWAAHGGTVHPHRLAFYDQLEASVAAGQHDAGASSRRTLLGLGELGDAFLIGK